MSTTAVDPSGAALPTALLIDDEEPLRHLVRRMLEPEVCRIVEASDGETGLRLLEQATGQIDVVITDLLMPGGLDGLDVLAAIQEHRPDLPVLVTSAFAGTIYPIVNLHPEHPRILHKPFSVDEIRSAVKLLISQSQKVRQRASAIRERSARIPASNGRAGQETTALRQRVDLVAAAWANHRQRNIQEREKHLT